MAEEREITMNEVINFLKAKFPNGLPPASQSHNGIATLGTGSVIGPDQLSKPDIGQGPYIVTVKDIIKHADCILFVMNYPTDKEHMHQIFLPYDSMKLQHNIIEAFNYLFGKKVEVKCALEGEIIVGSMLVFAEAR